MKRARGAEPDLPPGPARDLADLFKRLRRGKDLSGGQIAVATGLSPSHISEVLRGVTAPSPGVAGRIARALGATEDQARRAHHLAEQLGELNRYHRTHRASPATSDPVSPSGPATGPDMAGRGGQSALARLAAPSAAGGNTSGEVVEVFPLAIGYYADAGLADLDWEAHAGRLVDLLAPFGGRHRPWRHPARDRGADAVQRRLNEWSCPHAPVAEANELEGPAGNLSSGSSVLWWAGHGWSDGTRTALAHAQSPAVVGASGLEPQQLAQAIRARQAGAGPRRPAHVADGWALVILETEHATQIADAVMAALHGPGAPDRLLMVAVPLDEGSASGFAGMLANLLAHTYGAEHRVLLRDLATQLERVVGPSNVHQRALGEAALVRTWPPVASWLSAPVETIRHLEDVLASLSPDERSHFLAKAQGAEHGELSWFFEGRERELARVSEWLRQASSGMLVVTGRAGSGKSALLGTVLVRSLSALRDALARRGLVAATESDAAAVPESVFDAVVHLSGLNLAQATARLAGAAGIGPLPSHRHRDAGIATDLDFLAAELARRAGQFTVLADALDESQDPLDIARALLARIAALPAVRILVGTRASTGEAPDAPAGDENLLDALGRDWVIRVGQDQQAIGRYVTGRLRAARDYGANGRAIPHMREISDDDIQRAAREVAERRQEFLFARLAVYELIADPRLLTPGLAQSRSHLLQGTHQDLFGRALSRLAAHNDRYPQLMRALSLARGRGVPEADGIWATIAAALVATPALPPLGNPGQAASPGVAAGAAAAWAGTISGLLSQAAAYITADAESGGPAWAQTVYRLAHHTFVEYFSSHPHGAQDSDEASKLAATALLRTAAQAASARPGRLPAYLVRHLSGHAAEAAMWDDLAALPRVLDHIDPNAITTDAIRTLFGRRAVPPPIAGIIGARDTLAGASPADRPGLRQLATTVHSARHVIGERAGGWGIAAARAGRSTVHVRLSGHAGAISRVRSLTLPDGRTALASAGEDGTIRLWDPVAATPVAVLMKGHAGPAEDICVLTVSSGATLLASGGNDGTVRLWDLATGEPAGLPLTGHVGPVWGVCEVPSAPGQPSMLASVGSDGTVRLWDPATGQTTGGPLTGHTGPIATVCAVPGRQPCHPAVLATAGFDGTVRLWDLAMRQPAGPPLTGHAGGVYSVCTVPGQPSTLASAGDDGTVRLWDLATGKPPAPPSPVTPARSGACVRCQASLRPWPAPEAMGRCGCGTRPPASPPGPP